MEFLFEQKIRDKGLLFQVELPEDLPPSLLLDQSRLRQVLINLIGNAELQQILKKEKKRCQEMAEFLEIDELENFAQEMETLGETHQFSPLVRWAAGLKSATDALDTEQIQNQMAQFDQLSPDSTF